MVGNTRSPRRVLVVGQDQELIDLLVVALRQAAFHTMRADDTATAIRLVEQNTSDLVVADISDVLEGLGSLGKSCGATRTPLVALISRQTAVKTIADLKVANYLIKPISQRELVACIHRSFPHQYRTAEVGSVVAATR
jgi:DNA-binding response OmpR family regulator